MNSCYEIQFDNFLRTSFGIETMNGVAKESGFESLKPPHGLYIYIHHSTWSLNDLIGVYEYRVMN